MQPWFPLYSYISHLPPVTVLIKQLAVWCFARLSQNPLPRKQIPSLWPKRWVLEALHEVGKPFEINAPCYFDPDAETAFSLCQLMKKSHLFDGCSLSYVKYCGSIYKSNLRMTFLSDVSWWHVHIYIYTIYSNVHLNASVCSFVFQQELKIRSMSDPSSQFLDKTKIQKVRHL